MVEEDPNEEAYYEMGKSGTSNVPVSNLYKLAVNPECLHSS